MVFFTDRGGLIDAPIDVVWDYILRDKEFHPKAHRGSLRNLKLKKLSEMTDLVSCEVFRGGRWTKDDCSVNYHSAACEDSRGVQGAVFWNEDDSPLYS